MRITRSHLGPLNGALVAQLVAVLIGCTSMYNHPLTLGLIVCELDDTSYITEVVSSILTRGIYFFSRSLLSVPLLYSCSIAWDTL